MRRSYRDAIVGFSLLGGVVIFSGLTFWLKGVNVSSSTWNITANFNDATGLSEGTPVTFRGIKIGNVKQIIFTPRYVQAKIRIDKKNLVLSKPIFAKVETSSLLGGDAAISIISEGVPIQNKNYLPKKRNCPKEKILCESDSIEGYGLENISKLTSELNKILKEAGNEELLSKIVESIDKFDITQKNLDELIRLSKQELINAGPIIIHLKNILSSIDDPIVLNDFKSSTSSIRSFTAKLDKIIDTVDELINDDDLTNAIKDAAIGIGKLFNDIYQ